MVFLPVLLAHLMGDLYLLLALLSQLLVANRVAREFLCLADDLVLPGGRSFVWFTFTVSHDCEASSDPAVIGTVRTSGGDRRDQLSSVSRSCGAHAARPPISSVRTLPRDSG